MTYRTGHGNGKNALARIETLAARDQPAGLPAPSGALPIVEAVAARDTNGRIADRLAAAELGRRGGLARAAKAKQLRALSDLGLAGTPPEVLRPYWDAALRFAEAEVERLARECGAGICPQNAAALVQAGARAMAASCAAYAAGDLALGAKLGAELRSHLLGARELTVREAQGRANQPGVDPVEAMRARIRAMGGAANG